MYQPLLTFKQASILIVLAIVVSACIVGKDIHVGDLTTTEQEAIERSPVLGDTSTAAMLSVNPMPEDLELMVGYQDHLYHMRQQDFYYPRKGGGAYVIRYYEGNVIYAGIVGPSNTTMEDIVFFKENWYYNQNKVTEEISKGQAEIFVESILSMVSEEEVEESNVAVDEN